MFYAPSDTSSHGCHTHGRLAASLLACSLSLALSSHTLQASHNLTLQAYLLALNLGVPLPIALSVR
jgi:hypothetical protein